MTEFERCNKISGNYYSTDDINDFKFGVTIKEINKSLPVLELESPVEEIEKQFEVDNNTFYEERTISWQERVVRLTKTKSEDGEESVDEDSTVYKIVTYTDGDDYAIVDKITTASIEKFKHFKVKEPICNSDEVTIEDYLRKRTEKPIEQTDVTMYIVFDMTDHKKDTKMKRENLLFTLVWNPIENRLTVTPDFNDIQHNPYALEVNYDSKQIFHYSLRHVIQTPDDSKSTRIKISNKISGYEEEIRMRKTFRSFSAPLNHTIKYTVTFEILTAQHFENDDLYVEYNIILPEGFETDAELKGLTQKSSLRSGIAHFGHSVELNIIQRQIDNQSKMPQIYFEIVSCDAWDRRRTEGFCHMFFPLDRAGFKQSTLKAYRPCFNNRTRAELKRFFIGGRHTSKDITQAGIPDTFQGDSLIGHGLVRIATGELSISTDVIIQRQAIVDQRRSNETNVDSLFRGVAAALTAYKTARDKLKACLADDET